MNEINDRSKSNYRGFQNKPQFFDKCISWRKQDVFLRSDFSMSVLFRTSMAESQVFNQF